MAEQHSPTWSRRVRGARGWSAVVLRVVGSGLLIATATIHLDLYLTGYRTIPTIGWLFLLQVVVAFVLGLAVLATPSRLAGVPASRLVAAAGALFALATLGGYLLSVWIGLFGFKEVRTGAGIAAGLLEVAAFAVLAALALAPARAELAAGRPAAGRPAAGRPAATGARFPARVPPSAARGAAMTAAGLAVAALVLFGLAVAGASSAATASRGTALKTTTISGTTVLTNARGFTLYSYAPDTPDSSKCYGSCAAYWPPVTGTAAASSGLPGRVGTIKRTDGSEQLTYNGHPLYTYIADTAPGQARGNNVNLNGGLWHEVRVSR
jgi:predicted lipoprotein with Yx(FWY)xxD motif